MSAPRTELLAKSPRGTKRLTLIRHLLETEQAAWALFRADSRWGRSYPRFFKLEGAEQHARFLRHLSIASLFHDIGKANEDFQAAMQARGFKPQSLRHEHLSALLLCEPGVAAWLATASDLDSDAIVAAVLSHHLKAAPDGDWQVLLSRHAAPTPLYFEDDQVREAFARVAELAGLPRFSAPLPAARYSDAAWTAAWAHSSTALTASRAGCGRMLRASA